MVVYSPNATSNTPSLLDNFRDLIDDPANGSRSGVVHRLDVDTSGVMVLARTTGVRENLAAQFAEHQVTKHYRVLVHGHLKHKQARVELPIARSPKRYTQMVISRGGKPSTLEYKVLHRYEEAGFDLLDVELLTGRTHQIRVQLNYLGHTVVGDTLYGKSLHKHHKVAQSALPRQFVHAYSLKFKLPSGSTQTFVAPLAQDLADYLQTLS